MPESGVKAMALIMGESSGLIRLSVHPIGMQAAQKNALGEGKDTTEENYVVTRTRWRWPGGGIRGRRGRGRGDGWR
ncbi:hypothetical protein NH8B_0959 [Pseudogulbenkiania sp. NH8B]|nr:hypothetical protein NH8B_0959 [Pseudogulbenkiania sp. NH8B]